MVTVDTIDELTATVSAPPAATRDALGPTLVQLAQEGIDCRVLNMATLRPLDEEAIVRAAQETAALVTAEEHQIRSGMAAMVSQVVGSKHPVPMGAVGVRDRYAESGRWHELLEKYGLSAEEIVREVKAVLARKRPS